MNDLVYNRGKEIIIFLVVIILILITLLIQETTDSRIPKANLKNFINRLLDPAQNVHGVLYLTPDEKFDVLDQELKPALPCFQKEGKVLPLENGRIPIPPECTRKIQVDLTKKQQIIVLTAAKDKQKGYPLLIISDIDEKHKCVPKHGMPCP